MVLVTIEIAQLQLDTVVNAYRAGSHPCRGPEACSPGLDCSADHSNTPVAVDKVIDVPVVQVVPTGWAVSRTVEVPQIQFIAQICGHSRFAAETGTHSAMQAVQGVLGYVPRGGCDEGCLPHFYFPHSVQLDVSDGWRRCLESDSRVFRHPDWLHACSGIDKDIAVIAPSEPPPPPPPPHTHPPPTPCRRSSPQATKNVSERAMRHHKSTHKSSQYYVTRTWKTCTVTATTAR